MPRAWKNATIIFIHNKGEPKDFEKYRPLSLYFIAYRIFIKVTISRLGHSLGCHHVRAQAGLGNGTQPLIIIYVINQVKENSTA